LAVERAPGALASQIVDTILAFLPDAEGQVVAVDASEGLTQAEEAARRDE